jgi:excisionase family DNA binding protein
VDVVRRYATLEAAGEYVGGVNERTIRRMISRGDLTGYRLPGSRLLRVDLNELDRALKPVPSANPAA